MNLSELAKHYEQDNDCCDSMTFGQRLTVRTQDGGGGPYIVISTDRWAMNDRNEIMRLAEECCRVLSEVSGEGK